ncbi:unnamed protein product [Aureobasidium uvarum]|uniref:Uncharacterized protein n=1 Tax=Aureobasidium uvarum TaxID=2773716 RepID=A0A9N8PR73_9PEZI|nr:unnamed protein product [Aureobasidium uvarum]
MAVQSETAVRSEPKSTHVQDEALQPFLQSQFDPADYLNATLPSLTFSNPTKDRVPLAELSTQIQALISQLNVQTSRLTNTLNQLTDDILRSGSRLAYQVEMLRGETAGLTDALNTSLQPEIALFAPQSSQQSTKLDKDDVFPGQTGLSTPTQPVEPDYISKLRTLVMVRQRLDSVIKVFGEAMAWPIAPSDLVSSSFISVSAPSAGGPEETRNREEKAKEHAQKLRDEIIQLLQSAVSADEGIAAAIKRIDELRDLASIWQGTAEEKARARQIDGLEKIVEDEQKALARKAEARKRTASPAAVDYRYNNTSESTRTSNQGSGYGFMNNLRRIKDDIYLD